MKKTILFSILMLFAFLVEIQAQRKSTNVKGYFRKDGTYVRSHTRNYNSSNKSTSYLGNRKSKNAKTKENELLPISTMSIVSIDKSDFIIPKSKYASRNDINVIPSTLENVELKINPEKNHVDDVHYDTTGAVIFVSVLRYNGKTIDICPITRGILGDWEFKNVMHKFNKEAISTEDALELIANHRWKISGDKIEKSFAYSRAEDPQFLTRTIEAIKLK